MSDGRMEPDTSIEFRNQYNRLESWMKNVLQVPYNKSFVSMVEELSNTNAAIRNYGNYLKSMAQLRNAIVHSMGHEDKVIAMPLKEVVDTFKDIVETILQPPALMHICNNKPLIMNASAPLSQALKEMGSRDFSQILVKTDKAYGFISREGVGKWLEAHIDADVVSIQDTKIQDILPYEDPQACIHVRRTIDVFEALDLFGQRSTRVQLVVVTEHGSARENPLSLATPWDIGKLAHAVVARERLSPELV